MLDESSQPHINTENDSDGRNGDIADGGNDCSGDGLWDADNLEMQMDCEEELSTSRLIPKLERPDTPNDTVLTDDDQNDTKNSSFNIFNVDDPVRANIQFNQQSFHLTVFF